MTKPNPVGRPRLGKTPTERVEIRIERASLKRWQRAADAAGVTLSVWIRDRCDAAI